MKPAYIFLEAEAFDELGGWVIDQQFMDVMGSPFLLAHGLGKPVPDAITTVEFPCEGTYRLWVRTRDWVGPWKTTQTPFTIKAQGSPGIFQVIINGSTLPTTFGDSGKDWHWQDGGIIDINTSPTRISLHDLTGFEGRCDALLFRQDLEYIPPDRGMALASLRQEWLGHPHPAPMTRPFDLVIAGGGIAGMCAALAASRSGLTTALVQDRPVVGGNNSSEVRVWLGGKVNQEPYPLIGNVVNELEPQKAAHYGQENSAEIYEDDLRLTLLRGEPNLKVYLGWRIVGAHMQRGSIESITAQEIKTGRQLRFAGSLFADCTGDGDLGYLAGADYDMTLDGHLGPSNLWNVVDTGQYQPFPRCTWALDLSESPFPGRKDLTGQHAKTGLNSLGTWFWESGFNNHPIDELEQVRDLNFRAMYGAWDAIKNTDHEYKNYEIAWAAYITGLRESRRLLGDVILTQEDVVNGVTYRDGAFPCTWTLDLHEPDKSYSSGFENHEFISTANHVRFKGPYWAPYRCLYSRNINNLFMAGRNISVTHQALGTVRVMRTTGMMGEVVGLAASICKEQAILPRQVYTEKLDLLIQCLREGVPKTKIITNVNRLNEGGN